MKKKILYVDHTPFVGGAELVLASHIQHLNKDTFEPLVACSGSVPELVEKYRKAGAKVFVISFAQLKIFSPTVFLRLLRAVLELRSIIRRSDADLVVTNTERALYVGTLSAFFTRRRLVWWVRDFEYNRLLFRLLLRFPQKIICVSEAIRDYYNGLDNSKFEVVYVGSDFNERLRKVSLEDVLRLRDELRLANADFVVGFVGRLVEWKGPHVLLEAANKFKVQSSKFKIVIVGSGEGQEGNIEPRLRQMVEEYDLENQVVITGHRQDIPVLMKAFDVFCHTSIEPEPFATVVIEAMLASTPVIGTNIGGTPEIITNSQTGFLVPPNDPKALAAILSHLAKNQRLRQKIGERGKYVAYERNTEVKTTLEVEKIITEVLR